MKYDVNTPPEEHKNQNSLAVINEDCLNVARQLVQEGLKVCVLNMASNKTPGGGFLSGAQAQEESLCRRTSLYYSLTDPFNQDILRSQQWYPLKKLASIYCPDILVFRDSDYNILDKEKHFSVDIVTIAALRKPKVTDDNKLSFEDTVITKKKIITMLRLAIKHDMDAIVLSSFGWGAFGNPNQYIAQLFKEVLSHKEFVNKFKKIVFAVIDYGGTNNYDTFKKVLVPSMN